MIKRLIIVVVIAIVGAFMVRASHAHTRFHHYNPHAYHNYSDPRPHAWCGWFLRQKLGIADRSYNLAINWLHYGHPALGPCIGCIAIGRHHVAKIVGRQGNQWVTEDGNYNGRVHVGPRRLSWVIAYRQ